MKKMPLNRFENMGLSHLKGMSEYKIPIFNGKNLIYRILGHILEKSTGECKLKLSHLSNDDVGSLVS